MRVVVDHAGLVHFHASLFGWLSIGLLWGWIARPRISKTDVREAVKAELDRRQL